MALATNIKPLGNELNIDLQRKLTSFLYNSQLKAKYFLGLLGVILISIPFLIISPIFHIVLRSANKRLQQQLKDVYNWMNDASMSELIDSHLIIERNNKEYLQLLNMNKIIDKNPATMGISSEINKLVIQIVDLESSLKRAAYPNINKDLTVAELQELSAIFSDTIDWKDENLDVYENYVWMSYRVGDVVIVHYPYKDDKGEIIRKVRPPIVTKIQEDNNALMQITSVNRVNRNSGYWVVKDSDLGKEMGLLTDSFVNLEIVRWIPNKYIIGKIGNYSDIDKAIKALINLKIKIKIKKEL